MPGRRKRILLVDDEEDHRELIAAAFADARLDYKVDLIEAASLKEAKEKFQGLFDAAIVDWKLADGSGTDLLPGYAEEPTIPIVLMTNYGDEQVAVDALKKGAVDFVTKSEDNMHDMPQIVDRALRVWDLRQRELFFRTKLGSHQRMAELGMLAGSVIAHEMSNLVNAFRNYGVGLQRELHQQAYAPALESLRRMDECAKKCAQIIDHMRQFAIESRPTPRLFDIEEVVRSRVELLQPIIPANIEIVWRIDTTSRNCYADLEQFHSAIMNLITNARDAIGKRYGRITASLRLVRLHEVQDKAGRKLEPGQYHCLEISDDGTGISKEEMAHLFEPFHSKKARGMGLGLAASKRFAEQWEGALEAESQFGSGSTFRLWLPVAAGILSEQPAELELRYHGNHETILVVDDESWYLDSTTRLLEGSGYRVEPFLDPIKALEYLSEPLPLVNLFIVDQNMPTMRGTDFMRQVRQRGVKTPALLVTGYSDVVDRHKALRAGYQEFLVKPVDPRPFRIGGASAHSVYAEGR